MNPAQYDAWYDSPRGWWIGEAEYRLIEKQLALQPGTRVLDVGCGTGWFTRRLVRRHDLNIVGLDVNSEWLDYARSLDSCSCFVQGDALALPFHDNGFDSVISVAALCFTTDWRRAVGEIVRVCRGRFVVGMLNRNSLLWCDKGRGDGGGAYQGAHWLTPGELIGGVAHLPITDAYLRSAIFLPSGSVVARGIEYLVTNRLPCGGFVILAGHKSNNGMSVSCGRANQIGAKR